MVCIANGLIWLHDGQTWKWRRFSVFKLQNQIAHIIQRGGGLVGGQSVCRSIYRSTDQILVKPLFNFAGAEGFILKTGFQLMFLVSHSCFACFKSIGKAVWTAELSKYSLHPSLQSYWDIKQLSWEHVLVCIGSTLPAYPQKS